MSYLIYNGVTFTGLETQGIDVENTRDPANVDHLYTKYAFNIVTYFSASSSTFNSPPPPAIPSTPLPPDVPFAPAPPPPVFQPWSPRIDGISPLPVPNDETPASMMKRVEDRLRVPRRHLKYGIDSPPGDPKSVVVEVGEVGQTRADDANGPLIERLNISNITPVTWRVEFTVTCCVRVKCDNQPPRPLDYLALRWSETVTVDSDWLVTRRRQGYIVLSTKPKLQPSDGETRRDDIDTRNRRNLAAPVVPPGYRRESAEYSISEDGLTYGFVFVDKQMVNAPPDPAIRIRGSMSEMLPKGALSEGRISLTISGGRTTPRMDLVALACRIALARIYTTAAFNAKGQTMLRGGVSESLDDDKNEITLTLSWTMKAPSGRFVPSQKEPTINELTTSTTPPSPPPPGTSPPPGTFGPIITTSSSDVTAKSPQGKEKAAVPFGALWVGQPLKGAEWGSNRPPRAIEAPEPWGTDSEQDAVRLVAAALGDPCGSAAPVVRELTTVPANDTTIRELRSVPPAQLQFGVTATKIIEDTSTLYARDLPDDPASGSTLNHYVVHCDYQYDPGTSVLPATRPGERPQKVYRHEPMLTLRCEWSASRLGFAPIIPDPTNCPEEWVPGRCTITTEHLELAADGVTPLITVSGIYDYTSLQPEISEILAPFPPFLSTEGPIPRVARDAATLATWAVVFPFSTPLLPPPPPTSPPPVDTRPRNVFARRPPDAKKPKPGLGSLDRRPDGSREQLSDIAWDGVVPPQAPPPPPTA